MIARLELSTDWSAEVDAALKFPAAVPSADTGAFGAATLWLPLSADGSTSTVYAKTTVPARLTTAVSRTRIHLVILFFVNFGPCCRSTVKWS